MEEYIDRLNKLIMQVQDEIRQLTKEELTRRRHPGKWSKIQILGHLCDSALINLHRFIEIQINKKPVTLLQYNQDQWVSVQGYQNIPAAEVLGLFTSVNNQIISVISKIDEGQQQYTGVVGNNDAPVTFDWLVNDYADHLEHHLNQICGG